MPKVALRKTKIQQRKLRVRGKVFGTSKKPRFSVFRSNKYIYGQVVDDESGKTIASVSMNDIKKVHKGVSKQEAALKVGEMIAEKAVSKKVKSVVFDRNGYKFHGRVKNIADGLKKGGLEL